MDFRISLGKGLEIIASAEYKTSSVIAKRRIIYPQLSICYRALVHHKPHVILSFHLHPEILILMFQSINFSEKAVSNILRDRKNHHIRDKIGI